MLCRKSTNTLYLSMNKNHAQEILGEIFFFRINYTCTCSANIFLIFQCVTHYFDLIKDLNSRRLFRNYPLLVTKWRFLLLLLLTLTICCFFGGMNFVALQMVYSAVSYENPLTTENILPLAIVNIVGITLLLLLILCFFCCVPFCRKKVGNCKN